MQQNFFFGHFIIFGLWWSRRKYFQERKNYVNGFLFAICWQENRNSYLGLANVILTEFLMMMLLVCRGHYHCQPLTSFSCCYKHLFGCYNTTYMQRCSTQQCIFCFKIFDKLFLFLMNWHFINIPKMLKEKKGKSSGDDCYNPLSWYLKIWKKKFYLLNFHLRVEILTETKFGVLNLVLPKILVIKFSLNLVKNANR